MGSILEKSLKIKDSISQSHLNNSDLKKKDRLLTNFSANA